MRILGIVCSARKGGNTEILVKEALASAQEAGAQTELVSVIGKSIAPCDGCGSCGKTGVCHIKDDMQPLYEQLGAADGIIFGSPVYFGTVSAQAKAIMDRTFSLLMDRRLKGKVAAPVLAARRVGAGQTRNLLYGFFMVHGMLPVRGAIGYGREKGEVKQGVGGSIGLSALEEAKNVGTDVVQMVRRLSKPQG
ncbi:MAG TPA: flavodoxin family protein [Dehalococcoidia bacterium]|nr:flavodoxin family protein [Dehalococcoidia bacterium]